VIVLKSTREIGLMRRGGHILADVVEMLRGVVKAGMSTLEVDEEVEAFIRTRGAVPALTVEQGGKSQEITVERVILAVGICQWLAPMRPDHLAALLVQMLPVYLLYCMIGNTMSIYLPLVVRPGTAMPSTGQTLKLLLRFLAVMLSLVPLSLMAVPLGIEYLMSLLAWHTWFPAFLVFALIQAALTLWLYTVILDVQAEWLYRREQQILEVVTTRPD